jgi:hypothetical protein
VTAKPVLTLVRPSGITLGSLHSDNGGLNVMADNTPSAPHGE